MVDILIEIATNERFHVWNIHQHLPQKSPNYVGKYSIHGASGIWFMLVRENKTSKDCRTRRLSAFYPHTTTIKWPSHARLNLHSHMSHSPQQLRMGPQWYIIPFITGLLGHNCNLQGKDQLDQANSIRYAHCRRQQPVISWVRGVDLVEFLSDISCIWPAYISYIYPSTMRHLGTEP